MPFAHIRSFCFKCQHTCSQFISTDNLFFYFLNMCVFVELFDSIEHKKAPFFIFCIFIRGDTSSGHEVLGLPYSNEVLLFALFSAFHNFIFLYIYIAL